jgi:hypothetical protein
MLGIELLHQPKKKLYPDIACREAGGRPEGGRREAGGRPEGGRKEAGRRPEGGRREAGGRPERGRREAGERPDGGGKYIPVMLLLEHEVEGMNSRRNVNKIITRQKKMLWTQ